MTRVCGVYPDLVRTPGFQLCLHQAGTGVRLQKSELGQRLFATLINLHHALTTAQQIFFQRCTHPVRPLLPVALRQQQVMLVDFPLTQQCVQTTQFTAPFGDQQTAAGLTVQTVNKVSFSWLRANQMSLRFVTISLVRFLAMVGLNVYFIAADIDDTGAGLPIARLIGQFRDRIPAYASSAVLGSPEAYAEQAVEFRDELARTATGKLQKFKLREPFWAGQDRQIH